MPRLELLSARVTSQLVNKVQEALSPVLTIHDTYCWLDSQCALYWILGVTKELKTFVDNRVKGIRKFVPPEMWNYVNTNDNPGDITSRGCKASKLKESELWFHGPRFLTESSELWPKDFAFRNEIPGLDAKEFKRGSSAVCETNVNLAVTEPNVEAMINCEKFSDRVLTGCYESLHWF